MRRGLELPSHVDTADAAREHFDSVIKQELPQRPWVFDKATEKQIAALKKLDPQVHIGYGNVCIGIAND